MRPAAAPPHGPSNEPGPHVTKVSSLAHGTYVWVAMDTTCWVAQMQSKKFFPRRDSKYTPTRVTAVRFVQSFHYQF